MNKSDMKKAIELLLAEYPDAKPELHYNNAFELLIAAILSAQCTDVRVNIVTNVLFAEYTCATDFANCDISVLEQKIRTCGLYHSKAKNIIEACKLLDTQFGGNVPNTREELMTLPGVGRKVANVVLSNAFSVPAIAVDTHVFRVANRIGLACAKNVLDTEKQLMQNIDKNLWSKAHHLLIFHGRRICKAQKPACNACVLSSVCEHQTTLNQKGQTT